MGETKSDLIQQLIRVAQDLPPDKLAEAIDFAGFLRERRPPGSTSERGSAEALRSTFDTMKFEPGELEQLLAEIEAMRLLDMEPRD